MSTNSSARTRPYHHGNLRDALLDAAEQNIEAHGVTGLSMRELARSVGVSHAAPKSHFPDRDALLDALAQRGFERLGPDLDRASSSPGPLDVRFRATMAAFVAFATARPELLDLMFARKRASTDDHSALALAADHALQAITRLIEEATAAGALAPLEPVRYWLVLGALTRGIANLVLSGDIGTSATETLLTDATATFLRGNAPGT